MATVFEKKRRNSYSMKNRRKRKRVTFRNEGGFLSSGLHWMLKLRVLTSTEMFHFPSPLHSAHRFLPSFFVSLPFGRFRFPPPSICGISRNITPGFRFPSFSSPQREILFISVVLSLSFLVRFHLPITLKDPRIAWPINRLKTD